MLSDLIDGALDRSIVGGYSRIGYGVRSRTWARQQTPRMDGRRVLITGATSGIGSAAARELAARGAELVLLVRDRDRGTTTAEEIRARTGNRDVSIELCDLGSLDSVRACARRLTSERGADVLINNAGVLPQRYETTPDGLELAFATNVAGPFLLTALLLDELRRASPARVITVSSGGLYSQRLAGEIQMGREGYDGTRAYARTKRQELALSDLWSERVPASEVAFFTMHPGWVDTPGLSSSLPTFHRLTRPLLRDPAQGADTIVWLASAQEPEGTTGGLWHDRRRRPEHLFGSMRDPEQERERLWDTCTEITGLGEVPA